MTELPPAIERQLREAWARKEWEFAQTRRDYALPKIDVYRFKMMNPESAYDKDRGVPKNWRDLCKPPLDNEGDKET